MTAAIFDFSSINRRMNKKPDLELLVYDPMFDEMITPNELAKRQEERAKNIDIWNYNFKVGSTLRIA